MQQFLQVVQLEAHITVTRAVYIPDIYQDLMEFEALGEFKLFRFNERPEEKQNELIDKSAGIIVKSDFFKDDQEKLKFYKKYFLAAWERACFM